MWKRCLLSRRLRLQGRSISYRPSRHYRHQKFHFFSRVERYSWAASSLSLAFLDYPREFVSFRHSSSITRCSCQAYLLWFFFFSLPDFAAFVIHRMFECFGGGKYCFTGDLFFNWSSQPHELHVKHISEQSYGHHDLQDSHLPDCKAYRE